MAILYFFFLFLVSFSNDYVLNFILFYFIRGTTYINTASLISLLKVPSQIACVIMSMYQERNKLDLMLYYVREINVIHLSLFPRFAAVTLG